jgi:integrase/recombinase XerC
VESNPSHHRLNLSLNAKIGSSFDLNLVPDVLSQLLANFRSENTRLAYEKDVVLFFKWATGNKPTPDIVLEFLHLEKSDAVTLVLKYKAHLIRKGLAEATVNRRLAALKSLVAMGRKMGHCVYSLEDIKAEKVQRYRDTTGISPEDFKRVLSVPDRDTLQGKRDYALLRLLWGNALRRNEISQLNIGDFNQSARTLLIRGKGRGSQTESIDLSRATTYAIAIWLEASHVNGLEQIFSYPIDREEQEKAYGVFERVQEQSGPSARVAVGFVRQLGGAKKTRAS